jgi:molybdopterin-guanine dinucleotide biosynthesis protein A
MTKEFDHQGKVFMKYPYTGVILAGGLNTRFDGTNKAFIRIGGECIIDRLHRTFSELFQEIILVNNEPLAYLERDMMITADLFPIRSSLTGIHAGLFFADCPYAFFTACDTPFLQKEMIELILNEIGPGTDVVVPKTLAGFEPLCAVYSKECLKLIENRLIQQKLKIRDFFKSLRLKKIPENVLREKDPELLSFFNINTPDDLEKAKDLLT